MFAHVYLTYLKLNWPPSSFIYSVYPYLSRLRDTHTPSKIPDPLVDPKNEATKFASGSGEGLGAAKQYIPCEKRSHRCWQHSRLRKHHSRKTPRTSLWSCHHGDTATRTPKAWSPSPLLSRPVIEQKEEEIVNIEESCCSLRSGLRASAVMSLSVTRQIRFVTVNITWLRVAACEVTS